MKIKVLSAVLIFSLALNLAVIGTFVYKRYFGPDPRFHPMERMMRGPMFDEMDISNEDRDKIIGLFRDFRDANRGTQLKIRELEDRLVEKIQSKDSDLDAAYEIMEKIGEQRLTLGKKALNQFFKAKTFLTPEQQKHFYRLLMKNRPKRPFGRPPMERFNNRRRMEKPDMREE
jgi:Spy/CpxP family protein refolding chaperone